MNLKKLNFEKIQMTNNFVIIGTKAKEVFTANQFLTRLAILVRNQVMM